MFSNKLFLCIKKLIEFILSNDFRIRIDLVLSFAGLLKSKSGFMNECPCRMVHKMVFLEILQNIKLFHLNLVLVSVVHFENASTVVEFLQLCLLHNHLVSVEVLQLLNIVVSRFVIVISYHTATPYHLVTVIAVPQHLFLLLIFLPCSY